jgi:hypothetical protein
MTQDAAPAVRGAESEDAALLLEVANHLEYDTAVRDVWRLEKANTLRAIAARLSSRAAAPGEGAEDAVLRDAAEKALHVWDLEFSYDACSDAMEDLRVALAARSSSSPSTP